MTRPEDRIKKYLTQGVALRLAAKPETKKNKKIER